MNRRIMMIGTMGLVFCLLALTHTARAADDKDDADAFSFKWAFLKKMPGGTEQVIDFKKAPSVKKGDKLRIFFQPIKNVYIYLYMFDTSKDLMFVFPKTPSFFDKEYKVGEEYLLPVKTDWFEMDASKGTERFYLLASTKRLEKLEDLTAKFLKSSNDKEAKAKVIEEIQNVRKANSNLSSPAEKSVAIAGSVVTLTRGESAGQATLIEGKTFYAKTLRLKHE